MAARSLFSRLYQDSYHFRLILYLAVHSGGKIVYTGIFTGVWLLFPTCYPGRHLFSVHIQRRDGASVQLCLKGWWRAKIISMHRRENICAEILFSAFITALSLTFALNVSFNYFKTFEAPTFVKIHK